MAQDFKVIIRAVIIAAILLQALFIGLAFIWPYIPIGDSSFANSLRNGLNLFLLWMVVSSTLRSIYRLRPGIEWWKLMISGLGIVALTLVVQYAVFQALQMTDHVALTEKPSMDSIQFFLGIGFVVSFLSMIKLKVRSAFWAGVIELLFIGGLIYLFFFYGL